MFNYLRCALCGPVLILTPLGAEEKSVTNQPQQRLYSGQDRPTEGHDNPLKGFRKFVFFPLYPAHGKILSNKINALIAKTLKSYGEVDKVDINPKKGVIDLSPISVGATLIYEIENISSIEGKDLGIVRASLNFSTAVRTLRTNNESIPFVWSSNCFLLGSVEKDIEKLVSESLTNLLQSFKTSYDMVNSEKPVFNLYSQ